MADTVTMERPKSKAQMTGPHVFTAIAHVMTGLSRDGIRKDRKNLQQGYQFRGIDDVYNALAPILSEASLVIVPKVISREMSQRETQKGGVLFSVVVEMEFRLVSAQDGSEVIAGPFYGEAMDSGDKATNKAMSAAYKYMAMQTFCIPTEGDNDADAQTHEPIKKVVNPDTGRMVNPNSSAQLKKNGAWDSFMDRVQSFEDARDGEGLTRWFNSADVKGRVSAWPQSWQDNANDEVTFAFDRIRSAEREGV